MSSLLRQPGSSSFTTVTQDRLFDAALLQVVWFWSGPWTTVRAGPCQGMMEASCIHLAWARQLPGGGGG